MFKILSVQSIGLEQQPTLAHLAGQLRALGYELHTHQGHDGLEEEIRVNQPDLILLDPNWPEAQGFSTCESLKNNPDTESIPIIFVHHQNGLPNGELVRGFESGATDFISVASGEVEMLARVQAAIRNNQAANQALSLAQQLNKMNTELYERNLQVEKDLYVTRQLQQSLLPPIIPEDSDTPFDEGNAASFAKCHYKDDHLKISGVYLPCDALGGDIYDVIRFPSGRVGVAIADVSGHGVPAGFITAIFKSAFYRLTHNHSNPGDILFHLNNELADMVKTGEYVTGFYCCLQREESQPKAPVLEYSGAGHPYPLYYKAAEEKVYRLKENGTPLVWVKNMEYPMGRLTLSPGDKIFLFTDGLSEMRNTKGDLYSEEALEENFLRMIRANPATILDQMIQHLSDYTEGHPLEDDLSMVLIEMS